MIGRRSFPFGIAVFFRGGELLNFRGVLILQLGLFLQTFLRYFEIYFPQKEETDPNKDTKSFSTCRSRGFFVSKIRSTWIGPIQGAVEKQMFAPLADGAGVLGPLLGEPFRWDPGWFGEST